MGKILSGLLGRKGEKQSKALTPAQGGVAEHSPRFDPNKTYTSSFQSLMAKSMDEAGRLWTTEPGDDLFLEFGHESEQLDVFVSHVWYDEPFITSKSKRGAEMDLKYGKEFFFSMKSTGVLKASQQLEGRAKASGTVLTGLTGRKKESWEYWMDHTCVKQSSTEHKIHTIDHFKTLIKQSNALVVLLSPSYFERLWCLFEMSCFLALKDLQQVACYCWAFMDGSKDLVQTYANALRNLSVDNSKCKVEADRDTLRKQVRRYFVSEDAFCTFAKLSGIALILQSLYLSPAVFSPDRHSFFIQPFLSLATELGFDDLREAFESLDVLGNYKAVEGEARSAETNDKFTQLVLQHISDNVMPLVRQAAKTSLLIQ